MALPCSSPSVSRREDDRSATTKNHGYCIRCKPGLERGLSGRFACFSLGVAVRFHARAAAKPLHVSEPAREAVFSRTARRSSSPCAACNAPTKRAVESIMSFQTVWFRTSDMPPPASKVPARQARKLPTQPFLRRTVRSADGRGGLKHARSTGMAVSEPSPAAWA